MGGPDTNDDIDDALRGGGGNHQNDDVIYEWVLSELLRLLGLNLNTKISVNTHPPQSFVHEEVILGVLKFCMKSVLTKIEDSRGL